MVIKNKEKPPNGLWDSLTRMEASAAPNLIARLRGFEQPFRDVNEAGVQAPTLVGKRHQESDMRVAALFLKRTLNDLRSVWVLSCLGYASQSASIAASLFENALACTCIAGDSSKASKFLKQQSGGLPWTPIELSKLHANQLRREALENQELFDDAEFERAWREVYSAYKWLCQIKHPTLPSAMHDSLATNLKGKDYVVMAAPDVTDETTPVTATILAISLSRTYTAIKHFADALNCDVTQPYYHDFEERMLASKRAALQAYEELSKRSPPFDIRHTSLAQSYARLRNKKDAASIPNGDA